jgi:pyruvate dehydrogenase E2 component (dihydrolipoamide acetyltransferase)
LIHSNHIDPSSIRGSGPKGRILKGDVIDALANKSFKVLPSQPSSSSAPAGSVSQSAASKPVVAGKTTVVDRVGRRERVFVDVEVDSKQQFLASSVSRGKKDIPHSYVQFEISMKSAIDFAKTHAVSVESIIARALAVAYKKQQSSSQNGLNIRVVKHQQQGAAAGKSSFETELISAEKLRLTSIQEQLEGKPLSPSTPVTSASKAKVSLILLTSADFKVSQVSEIMFPGESLSVAAGGIFDKVVMHEHSGDSSSPFARSVTTSKTLNIVFAYDESVADAESTAALGQTIVQYIENPKLML